MKLILENWKNFVQQQVEDFLPDAEVRSVNMIGSSALSPEERAAQDLEKYGYVRDDSERDIDIEVQVAGASNEDIEAWAFSEEAEELEATHNYDVQLRIVEGWREYLKEADDFDWDEFGFSDDEKGESAPNPPQYEDLISLDRGDTFTIGNRKPVYRVVGALTDRGTAKGSQTKLVVIDGSAERKAYELRTTGDDYEVGAFGKDENNEHTELRGKTGFVMNIKRGT